MVLCHMTKMSPYTLSRYPENPIICWKVVDLTLVVYRMETTPDNKIYILNKCSDSNRLWRENEQQKIRPNYKQY